MPRFQVERLPNDHTMVARPGALTPRSYVAQNDAPLGMLIEGISRPRFWKDTAVFTIEDDAQNGPDHVDTHRTVAMVISPYPRRRNPKSTWGLLGDRCVARRQRCHHIASSLRLALAQQAPYARPLLILGRAPVEGADSQAALRISPAKHGPGIISGRGSRRPRRWYGLRHRSGCRRSLHS